MSIIYSPTDESGYKNVINPVAINIDKPEEQKKI